MGFALALRRRFGIIRGRQNPQRAKNMTELIQTELIQVVTTTERHEDAQTIARALIEERLAACVQVIGPITSTYRWEGNIETSEEWQCWAKSRQELYAAIEQAIRRLHSYQVPEILAVDIVAGGGDYLTWLDEQVKRPGA